MSTEQTGEKNVHATADKAARDWLVRLYSGEVSDADKQAFREWLQADRAHALAYRSLERAWRALPHAVANTAATPSAVTMSHHAPSRTHSAFRRVVRPALATAACLLVGVITLAMLDDGDVNTVLHTTGTGETRTVTLADASVVTLSARSSIEVQFSEGRREVKLIQGEAYFDVSHNAAQPFTVMAGENVVTVTGTEFDVRIAPSGVRVAVTEGSVSVADMTPDSDHAETVQLTIGQQVNAAPDGAMGKINLFDATTLMAWQSGRLVYIDALLADVVADANRYREIPIRLEGEALESVRITTAFRTDRSNDLLTGLEASYDLRVKKQAGWISVSAQN